MHGVWVSVHELRVVDAPERGVGGVGAGAGGDSRDSGDAAGRSYADRQIGARLVSWIWCRRTVDAVTPSGECATCR